jgi:hypothetical protein
MPDEERRIAASIAKAADYLPSTQGRCCSSISSAMLVRESRTNFTNRAFGPQERRPKTIARRIAANIAKLLRRTPVIDFDQIAARAG